ncbi:hypothetical protein [Streptomyces sp. bgisy032]|uniref:hypothetical protein n=1 Tax=Streptomyces sp. bgisy032 TaxID=3413773 RepID=UPI003D70FB98
MPDLIPRALRRLRLLLAPGSGKRRRGRRPRPHLTPVRLPSAPPTPPLPRHRSPYGLPTPLDGAASALVRPYLDRHPFTEQEVAA